MNDRERQALDALLTYSWDDECVDFNDQDSDGRERHIFREMLILRAYLRTHGLIESEDGS